MLSLLSIANIKWLAIGAAALAAASLYARAELYRSRYIEASSALQECRTSLSNMRTRRDEENRTAIMPGPAVIDELRRDFQRP
jgi:hypothetical protein